MSRQEEYNLHVAVVNSIKTRWPSVLFRSDLGGVRVNMGTAMKIKPLQRHRGWPDLMIAEKRFPYNALFLEIKTDLADLLTKNGQRIKAGARKHILEQAANITMLEDRSFAARFVFGYDDAMDAIEKYLDCEWPPNLQSEHLVFLSVRLIKDRQDVLLDLDPVLASWWQEAIMSYP